jgi:two-component system response regulator YesN
MYKVLLVDDESIIIESISKLIDWGKYDLELVGAARNGLEAYKLIKLHKPHIVITDIKMPGMDGLDLMRKVKEDMPNTVFIILSGYGEFDFASKAIQYGVKHYLLKPCDEEEIIPVLTNIVKEFKIAEKKERFLLETRESLEKVLPQVKGILKAFLCFGVHIMYVVKGVYLADRRS